MKETTYDRNKKKINKELNKVKESGIKYWRHQSSWQKPKYFNRDGVHLNDDGRCHSLQSVEIPCLTLVQSSLQHEDQSVSMNGLVFRLRHAV
jgi:hypothetical protein